MILLVLVAVLWIVVLLPGALRRYGERNGAESIDHFHHQLQLLEHAGPKIVSPAYRLHTAHPGAGTAEVSDFVEPISVSSRPKLVLVRPVGEDREADIDGEDGTHYERIAAIRPPEPPTRVGYARTELAAHRRDQARRRCTLALRILTVATVTSGIIGMMPSARLVWIATGLFGLALLGLIGLMGYAREVEALRRRSVLTAPAAEASGPFRPASAGYPGAWDDELDLDTPRVAAR